MEPFIPGGGKTFKARSKYFLKGKSGNSSWSQGKKIKKKILLEKKGCPGEKNTPIKPRRTKENPPSKKNPPGGGGCP